MDQQDENPFQSPKTVDEPPVLADAERRAPDFLFLLLFSSLVVTLSEIIFYEARVPGAYVATFLSGCGLFLILHPRVWAWRVALGMHALQCVYLGAASLWELTSDFPLSMYLLLCCGLSGAIVYWLNLPIMRAYYHRTTENQSV